MADRVYVLMYDDGHLTEVAGVYRSKKGMLQGFKELIAISLHVPVDEIPTNSIFNINDHAVKFTLEELIEYFVEEAVYTTLGGRTISYDKYSTIKP